jgi:hypothetical protein
MRSMETRGADSLNKDSEELRLFASHEKLLEVLVFQRAQLGKTQKAPMRIPKMAVGLIKSAKMAYLVSADDLIYEHLQTSAIGIECASSQFQGMVWAAPAPQNEENVFERAFGAVVAQTQHCASRTVVIEREVNDLEYEDSDTDQERHTRPLVSQRRTSMKQNFANLLLVSINGVIIKAKALKGSGESLVSMVQRAYR